MKLKTTFAAIAASLYSISLLAQEDTLLFSPKGIAEIRITLLNGKKIGDIKNEKNDADYAGKLEATMQVKNSGSSTYESPDMYNGRILIEGRGNTTWGVPKRPYNIDLVTSEGEENPAALLNMPEADEWSLLAFWHDRSLMRIPLAMYLGERMSGIQWTPRMRYAELWINNEYRGLYCLSEKIQRNDNRIDIKKLTGEPEDQSEPRISGGYILEGSTEGKLKPIERDVQFKTSRDINFTFKYPKPRNVTPAQREWIRNYINEFEAVLWDDGKFKDPENGYRKYIDVESFIDWTILHEQSKGVDNLFHASTFVHKDRNGKLNMSAPWDFDLSYGNGGDRKETGNGVRRHRWFDRLSKDEVYMSEYRERFDELLPLFNQIPQILQANYAQLEETGVIDRENLQWPQILWEFSGEDGMETPYTYRAHVRFLSDWLQSRNVWCYIELGANSQEKGTRLENSGPVIRVMDPEALDYAGNFQTKVMEGFSYLWNDETGATTNNTKRINQKGKYWVKIKDESGNISLASDTLYVGVDPPVVPPDEGTALTGYAEPGPIRYNNPVKGVLDIRCYSPEKADLLVRLMDINGSKRISKTFGLSGGENQIQIPVSGLAAGIYLLYLSSGQGAVSRKVILENP
ncbi:MAG: CotH kinase family protein [Candidatus Symbiothrix sp.]|jgi:hypothetical protein|nr:CotH kinase family protein [Candidatus Symbiothrix sp.]